jgi:hypothetical protein
MRIAKLFYIPQLQLPFYLPFALALAYLFLILSFIRRFLLPTVEENQDWVKPDSRAV